jgi:glycosyltransferase involved in cell wall biosynthesis
MIPDISIIICTYNKPELIRRCIKSILKQEIDKNIEIIIVDGGSGKKTIEVINRIKKENKGIIFIDNPEKLPEGYGKGKWKGFKHAKGEIVGIIDQDNELIGKDCLKNLTDPFYKDKNISGVACRLFLKKEDNLTNQCIALIGTDPFFAYRSLDYLIHSGKLNMYDEGGHHSIKVKKDNLLIFGGNCFFYRKKFLENIGGYVQDVDNIHFLVSKGYDKIGIPKNAFTHHYAVNGFTDFIRKKKKWAYEYSHKERTFSWKPKTGLERKEWIKNLSAIFIIFPLFSESINMTLKTKEKRFLLMPFLKIITTFIYITQRRYIK